MIESWMISLVIAVAGFIASAAVNRFKTNENTSNIEKLWERSDSHYADLKVLKTQQLSAITMEQVDEKFVEIRMWELQNKHIDKKFDSVEKSMEKGFLNLSKDLKNMVPTICRNK